jgi:hypothetical protein
MSSVHSRQFRKFVFVNYSGEPCLQESHGKAIGLNINDHHVPFPSIFIIHELRVRGFHPFQPVTPNIIDGLPSQDWILSDGVFDHASNSFYRDRPPGHGSKGYSSGQSQLQLQPATQSAGAGPSGGNALALNNDVIAEIFTATREIVKCYPGEPA